MKAPRGDPHAQHDPRAPGCLLGPREGPEASEAREEEEREAREARARRSGADEGCSRPRRMDADEVPAQSTWHGLTRLFGRAGGRPAQDLQDARAEARRTREKT